MKLLLSLLTTVMLAVGIPVKDQLAQMQKHFSIQLVYDANIEKLLKKECEGVFNPEKDLRSNLEEVLSGTGISWIVDGRYVILKSDTRNNSAIKRQITARDYVKDKESVETLNEARITSFKDAGLHSTRPGSMEISQVAIKSSPVVLGEADVLKTLQLMPGIQSGMEGFSGIYVRGGGPDENLIMLDGVPVYNVNHMFGLFSAFTPETVKSVTVYTGAFPAQYGGRVSSVVDVISNDGNENELRGSISAGLLSDKIYLEGPLGNGKTTFSAGARAMHTFLVSPVMAFRTDKLNYLFYDLNGKITHRFSDKDRISFSIYSGMDNFRYRDLEYTESIKYNADDYKPYICKNTDEIDIKARYGNTVTALRHTHAFGNNMFSDAMVAWNIYRMNMSQKMADRSFKFSSGIKDITVKDNFDWRLSNSSLLNFGGEYIFHRFKPEQSAISISGNTVSKDAGKQIDGHEFSLYASDKLSISDRLSAEFGARLTLFHVQGKGKFTLQPRLSMQYLTGADMSIKASYSRMSQYIHLLSTGSMSLPTDLWVPVTEDIGPEIADIISAGTYYTGLKGWEMTIEAYYRKLANVIDYADGTLPFSNDGSWEDNVSAGNGRAYGAETMISKTCGKTTGSLSYTLSWSDRIFPDGNINNGNWFPYQYDRRHRIILSVAHRFNERVDINGLWTFSSGNCMTVPEKKLDVIFPDIQSADGFGHMTAYHAPSKNNYRLPPSHRLDISANFKKQKRNGERIWTVGIYNVYSARNPNWVLVDYKKSDTDPGTYQTYLSIRSFLTALPFFSYTFNF